MEGLVFLVGSEFWFCCWFALTHEKEVLPIGLGVKQSEGRVVGQEYVLNRQGGQK